MIFKNKITCGIIVLAWSYHITSKRLKDLTNKEFDNEQELYDFIV